MTSLSSCVLNGVAYRSEVSKNFKRATGTLIDDFDGSNAILTASGPVVEAFAPYYYDDNQTNQNGIMIPEMHNHPSQVMYYYYQPNRGYNPTGFNITVSDQNNNLFVLPLPMGNCQAITGRVM